MSTLARTLAVPLAALAVVVALAAMPGRASAALAKLYKCPPCGSPCDTTTFLAAGACPSCGMALVEEGSAAAPDPDRKRVAILVFSGCQIVDFTGPYEMFGAAGCDVYTVAASRDPVTTAMGLTVVPRYTFADGPQPDVLVIPGGAVRQAGQDAATLAYIRKASAGTQHTMSVCNGAFILANTGLLDGLTATTTASNIPHMAAQYPKIKVVHNQRFVDNGHFITTAGLSAGMDGALHVIAKLFGTGYAQAVALGEEYDWKTSNQYARAALADQQIPPVPMDSLGTWNYERTEGDTRRWDLVMTGKLLVSPAECEHRIESALAAGKWKREGPTAGAKGTGRTSTWRFTGSDGKPWRATLKLEAGADAARDMKASLSLAQQG